MAAPSFTQVKKVISIIESCKTTKQLITSRTLIKNYIKLLKFKRVINYNDVAIYLFEKYDIIKLQIQMQTNITQTNPILNNLTPLDKKDIKSKRKVRKPELAA